MEKLTDPRIRELPSAFRPTIRQRTVAQPCVSPRVCLALPIDSKPEVKNAVEFSDHDWRAFTRLREQARERFAEHTLAHVLRITLDESAAASERQSRLNDLIAERRREQVALFDDFRRATASLRLHMMVQRGLIEEAELDVFTVAVRRSLMPQA